MSAFNGLNALRHAAVSLTVMDTRNGTILFNQNDEMGLAPASCLKTVTAASAFYMLGTDYHYITTLGYSGSIRNDTLWGDIIIRGSGDPTLGSWRYESCKTDSILQQWTAAIRQAGIKVIAGQIIGDASVFDTQTTPDGWIWQDMGNYYGAGPSGLSWHENQYDLHLHPGHRVGEPVMLNGTEPAVPSLHFINELSTGPAGSGDHTYIYTAPYGNEAYLRGTAPAGVSSFIISGSVPDPALFCAQSLLSACHEANIEVTGTATTRRLWTPDKKVQGSNTEQVLSEHLSPSFSEICYWFLHKSINLYGEHLLKTMLLEQHKPVSTANGVEMEKRFWQAKGIDSGALNIEDGSGLSPGNRITTKAMASILYKIRQESWFSTYYDCLPDIHNIRMKSGHIGGVCSYAGYLTTREGVPVVFSFIVNNYLGSSSVMNEQMWKVLDRMKGR